MDLSNSIVTDTIQGALALSIFDFVACFFVLYFISFFIRGITYLDEKILLPSANQKKLEDEQNKRMLP